MSPTRCHHCKKPITITDRVFIRDGRLCCSAECLDATADIPTWFIPAIIRIVLYATIREAINNGVELDVAALIDATIDRISLHEANLAGDKIIVTPAMLVYARKVLNRFDVAGHYARLLQNQRKQRLFSAARADQ